MWDFIDLPRIAGMTWTKTDNQINVWVILDNGCFYRYGNGAWSRQVNFPTASLYPEERNHLLKALSENPDVVSAINKLGLKL
jgi:hypothetical protein